jgi:hypothetical protein
MPSALSPRYLRFGACLLAATVLAGCGPTDDPATYFTVSGNVSGLNGTLVLAADGGRSDSIAVTVSGGFTFTEQFESDSPFSVFVYKQPLGQTCTFAGGSVSFTTTGAVGTLAVSCADNPFTVGGTVSGLTSGSMSLQLNLADNLVVGNGPFTFPKPLATGAAYAVSILAGSQTTHTCAFANGAGTLNASVSNVAITCAPLAATYPVGGNVAGLTGTVVLRNSVNGELVTRSANGSFTFPTALTTGTEYFVSVETQPVGQTCSVSNGLGNVAPFSAGIIGVVCANGTDTRTVGGVVTGLKAPIKLGLQLNNAFLDLVPAGTAPVSYTFPVPLQAGTKYQVFIRNQPAGQTCIIPRSGGTLGQANVTNISVVCVDNVTDSLSGTYMAYDGEFAMTFYPGGTYVHATVDDEDDCGPSLGNGVEVGAYRYNATTGSLSFITNLLDTNGSCGVWGSGGSVINNGTLVKTGAAQGTVLLLTPSAGQEVVELVPVPSVANRLVGAFVPLGGLSFMAFTDDGQYLGANANDDPAGNAPAGVEYGCFTATAAQNGAVTPLLSGVGCDETVNTDGVAGLSGSSGSAIAFGVGPLTLNLNNGGTVAVRSLPN